jgi:3-hydroxymyristoyl/3-hydroxydecanoyl-(acyl carrier protein) dehydratase
MGFLFVDRIDALDERGASGQLDMLPGRVAPPHWLILEAVGQLAGWVATARTDFAHRAVAAMIGEVALGDSPWCAGGRGPVQLTAKLERIDSRAILYSGTASCEGREIARLARCVGPLLPLALFDDPEVVRQRLAVLRAGGGPPRNALLASWPTLTTVATADRDSRQATLQVPLEAPYFADHFPRRPVFPASLLAAALDALAAPLAGTALGATVARVVAVRELKVRAFSEPGTQLVIAAAVEAMSDGRAAVRISAETDGRKTASGWLDYRVAS